MKARLLIGTLLLTLGPAAAQTNVAPEVVILSANMRAGTTLMDIFFRVNDPDDATVKVRALAFKDGVRSFANVIRPITFAEGSGDKIGDTIPANANHALTWNVAADWNIDLGQAKFEILAMDGRGLLSFDWITIPAAGGYPEVTISKNSPGDSQVLDALFWLYASGDPGLSLTNYVLSASSWAMTNGILSGSSNAGAFGAVALATNTSVANYAVPFLLKEMNLAVAKLPEIAAANTARADVASGWLAANRPYSGLGVIVEWGDADDLPMGEAPTPAAMSGVIAIAAGNDRSLALKSDGTVVAWGETAGGWTDVPTGLTGVVAIAAGEEHAIALKSTGTVTCWGNPDSGRTTPPPGLSNVTAVAAGADYTLALKQDGTVVGWGGNMVGQSTPPMGLSNVTAIAAGGGCSLALKSDGTVVAWGSEAFGQAAVPANLTNAIAVAAGLGHALALKADGTVVGWGRNDDGEATPPTGLTGVTAIAAGAVHSLALKSDGSVVAWGRNDQGQTAIPAGLGRVKAIAAGFVHSLALTDDAP